MIVIRSLSSATRAAMGSNRGSIDRCSAEQGSQENYRKPNDMREWQNAIKAVFGVQGPDFCSPPRRKKKVVVGQHDAFGKASRTRRINQGSDATPNVSIDRLGLTSRLEGRAYALDHALFYQRSMPVRM